MLWHKQQQSQLDLFRLLTNRKIVKVWKNKSRKLFEEFCFNKSVDLRKRLMNSKDEFMFKFVFDLWYKVAAFSMFLCLLVEVVSYLFYSKRPPEIKSWINPSRISPQGTKRSAGKRLQHRYRPVNFAEFLRTHLFKNTSTDGFWR